MYVFTTKTLMVLFELKIELRWFRSFVSIKYTCLQISCFLFFTLPFAFLGLQVRNNYRHYFLSSKALKVVYDAITWAATQLAVSYTVAPFVMLAVEPTISLYK